jgi:hypothetical protein
MRNLFAIIGALVIGNIAIYVDFPLHTAEAFIIIN